MMQINHVLTRLLSSSNLSKNIVLICLILMGCQDVSPRNSVQHPNQRLPRLGTLQGPLMAYCDAQIIGVGSRDIESDYLPHVINCENGGAGLEALKAQAVAARSYLYYRLNNSGDIEDGQSDQVYTCGREPGPLHFAAVEATSGEVLSYESAVIAAFYVAGAIPSTASCIPADRHTDRYNTERFVTYNQGLSGDQVIQTPLGWVNPGNLYNRGCKSQNGAACLADSGMGYQDILRFYYGADITIERASGECILTEITEMGGETPSGEEISSGESTAGFDDQSSGEQMVNGGQVDGGQMAGDQLNMGGEMTSGDSITSGTQVAGESNTSSTNPSNPSGQENEPPYTESGVQTEESGTSNSPVTGSSGMMSIDDEVTQPTDPASLETGPQCAFQTRLSSTSSSTPNLFLVCFILWMITRRINQVKLDS